MNAQTTPRIPMPGPGFSSLKIGSVLIGALIFLVLLGLWLGIYRIDAGHVGIVKRFGNVIDVVDPGLHVKVPYADTVEEMEVRERAFTMKMEAASQDPLELPVTVTVNWLVKRNHVEELYIQFGSLVQFEK
ncbi:MAG: SPFH domain-containing protein, partial [Pseudomonadota bacterium]